MSVFVPVEEWRPDLAADLSPDTVSNVLPDVDSYRPWQDLDTLTGVLGARAQGAAAGIDLSRNVYNYAGDVSKLYRLVSLSWNDASRTITSVATYTTSSDTWWEFAQWGETVIAVNGTDEPQEITLGAAQFANLAGAPPVASHIAIVQDFVWLGNVTGSPQRVQWSAINNSRSWTVDAATQADYQDLAGNGGHVQKILGGNTALVFQERAIWRAQYVSSPKIFDFGNGPIEPNIGALAPQSVVRYGDKTFFLGEGGFFMLSGEGLTNIGQGKVNRTFFADMDSSYIYRVQAIIDPIEHLYICCYPGAGNTGGRPNKLMIYNFHANRWSRVSEEVEMLLRYISTGYTLEGLDSVANLDALPESLDSSLWLGGQISLAGFDSLHAVSTFTGAAKAGTVETQELQLIPGKRSKVLRARPLVEGLDSSITPLTRNNLADSKTTGSTIAQNTTGDCPIRANAKYHSFRIATSGTFGRIRGVEVMELSDSGTR